MVMAPHADDEIIGAGAMIHRLSTQGAHVTLLLGSFRTEERLAEARHAADILLATELVPLCQQPADEVAERELVGILEHHIERVQPTHFIIPEDAVHPEHRLWHRAGVAATRPSGGSGRHRPAHVWCWEAPADQWGKEYRPNIFVRVQRDDMKAKEKALRAHRSQFRESPSERSPEALHSLARLRGSQAGVEFAEAFRSLRDLL